MRTVCGKPVDPVRGKVLLEIIVHRGQRQDPDNAYASVKHLVDALVRAGWLEDDSPELLDLWVTERVERRKEVRRTVVRWSRAQADRSGGSGTHTSNERDSFLTAGVARREDLPPRRSFEPGGAS